MPTQTKPPKKFMGCVNCKRLMPEDATTCDHCGTVQIRRRPDPLRAAAMLLMSRVCEIRGDWTESIDNAMQELERVLKATRPVPNPDEMGHVFCQGDQSWLANTEAGIFSKDRAAAMPTDRAWAEEFYGDGVYQFVPLPISCAELLARARDSMQATLDDLTLAQKDSPPLASLLLLDMIEKSCTMSARIRAILNAVTAKEGQ